MSSYKLSFSEVTDLAAFLTYCKNYVSWKSMVNSTDEDDANALYGKELQDINLACMYVKENFGIRVSLMDCLKVIYSLDANKFIKTEEEIREAVVSTLSVCC